MKRRIVLSAEYQQFMFALAIPPRAWMSPGPDTTRQEPGLDTNNHRRQQHVRHNRAAHINVFNEQRPHLPVRYPMADAA